MAVKIRLARHGKKKRPFYRVVVANSEARRDGSFIEIVGTYDPFKDPAAFTVDRGKIEAWLAKGALPTQTVRSLMVREGL